MRKTAAARKGGELWDVKTVAARKSANPRPRPVWPKTLPVAGDATCQSTVAIEGGGLVFRDCSRGLVWPHDIHSWHP